MRCLYRERRYFCGDYLEVNIFPVYEKQRGRSKRRKPTSEVQAKLNERNAEERLVRLLNANFTGEDIEIHLTYATGTLPETDEDARRDVQNYLRRVKRKRKKEGLPELKYVAVTEGEAGGRRYHHHITMSGGIDRSELEELWGYGYANARRLQFCETGVEALARYVTKQFRDKKSEMLYRKRWNASKNLVQPKPIDRDGKVSAAKVRDMVAEDTDAAPKVEELYPGYACADVRVLHNEFNGGFYIVAKMYRRNAELANRKKRRGERRDDGPGEDTDALRRYGRDPIRKDA